MPTATDAEVLADLRAGDLTVVGRIAESSNQALLVTVAHEGRTRYAVHKPVALERPLWDFPDGSHAGREHAAYLVDRAGGFGLVPATTMREGPFGPGSLQAWVGDPEVEPDLLVAVTDPAAVPEGWLTVISGEDAAGRAVVLSHSPDPAVRSMAVLDALLNNSDRKGGHVLRDATSVRGIDHGVSLSVEPKLRTVLWGWAGQPLPAADVARVRAVVEALATTLGERLREHLTDAETAALAARADALLASGRHPVPSGDWPSVPWPAM